MKTKIIRSEKEIEDKVWEIAKEEKNFCNIGWGYGEDDEYGSQFSECNTNDALYKFYNWLIGEKEE